MGAEIKSLEIKKNNIEQILISQKEELSKLSIFSICKKMKLKDSIEYYTREITRISEKIYQKRQEKNSSKIVLEKERDEKVDYYRKHPRNYQYLVQQKKLIIDVLTRYKKPVTTSELLENSELSEMTNQRLLALLTQLIDEGRVIRILKKKIPYYTITTYNEEEFGDYGERLSTDSLLKNASVSFTEKKMMY